jgi:hypothetical protein
LIRRESDLEDLVAVLVSLPSDTPLAVGLEVSKYEDSIWLLSIEVEGEDPWLIDVQKVGGHKAITSELRSVLESHPI